MALNIFHHSIKLTTTIHKSKETVVYSILEIIKVFKENRVIKTVIYSGDNTFFDAILDDRANKNLSADIHVVLQLMETKRRNHTLLFVTVHYIFKHNNVITYIKYYFFNRVRFKYLSKHFLDVFKKRIEKWM